MHKDVWPLMPLEYVGIFVLPLLMALCAMAGIGGGGAIVSIYMFFFIFQLKNAIALSSFSCLISAVVRYIFNLK